MRACRRIDEHVFPHKKTVVELYIFSVRNKKIMELSEKIRSQYI